MTEEEGSDPLLKSCLANIGCDEYIPIFCHHEIDFACFKALTLEELKKLLPNKIGIQRKIFKEIERIQSVDNNETSRNEVQNCIQANTKTTSTETEDENIIEGKNMELEAETEKESPKTIDKSFLSKYGYMVPVVGVAVAGFGAGLVKKMATGQLVGLIAGDSVKDDFLSKYGSGAETSVPEIVAHTVDNGINISDHLTDPGVEQGTEIDLTPLSTLDYDVTSIYEPE